MSLSMAIMTTTTSIHMIPNANAFPGIPQHHAIRDPLKYGKLAVSKSDEIGPISTSALRLDAVFYQILCTDAVFYQILCTGWYRLV